MPHKNDWYQKILEDFHQERNTAAFYKTQGFKKLWRYLVSIVEKDEFQKIILGIRNEFSIPLEAFPIIGKSWNHPPKKWKLYSPDWVERLKIQNQIREKLEMACNKYGLPPRDFVEILEDYLFYNKLFLTPEPNGHNLCYVIDLKTKRDSLGSELTDKDIENYPVALLINPSTSKRDILDFVEKLFKTAIRPLQEKYKKPNFKIGSVKKTRPDIRARNKFIYENRNLPVKEIRRLLWSDKHLVLKSKDISKILSLEKAKKV